MKETKTKKQSKKNKRETNKGIQKEQRIDEERKRASVFLKPEEISKAIGKKGINIKLASKLTSYTIDVYREGFEESY